MHVSFFSTCLVDNIFPDIGIDSVKLLERLGCTIVFNPQQTCCGQPLANSGYQQKAKKSMHLLLDTLLEDEADYIVAPSGSCVLQIKEYSTLFADDHQIADKAGELAAKTFELTDFIVNVLQKDRVESTLRAKAVYHPSCHMTRLLGVKEPPLTLLANVAGLELVPCKGQDKCCGFGGTFSVKMADLSGAMVAEKVDNFIATGADCVIGCDAGCLMNIKARLERLNHPMQVLHIANVLAHS
ncbi:(Fe-S)-binding protein [Desulfogranum marinum]|jgi:L-lactate dehydrogenase complex protein LldE|uniref:(Fe-S)-binding protein n=1 Tax=Desulfogranum marinum TaxID=453220 RepID=UPI001966AC4F|nr:(Fe-S)-binding protein [Desulfogranum marinum]MBM9513330.1 (Fe-S)-binding protein [Desulfogranum marinum]